MAGKGGKNRTSDYKEYHTRRDLVDFNPKCVVCETRKPIEQMRMVNEDVCVCTDCHIMREAQEEDGCE